MEPAGRKTYVDVLMRVCADGTEVPQAVILPDGRMYEVTKISSVRKLLRRADFSIMIGEHATCLHVERGNWTGPRFYVYLRT